MARTIRPARVEDYHDFVRWFDELRPRETPPTHDWWERSYADALILEEGPRPVGYVYVFVLTDEHGRPTEGHVGQLVVDASVRRCGLGRFAMQAAAARFRNQGCPKWSLHVREDNAPARALYESCGLRVVASERILRMPWSRLRIFTMRAERQTKISIEPLLPEHRAEAEHALRVPIGQLTRLMRIPGRRMTIARASNAIVGVLGYDPERTQTMICRAHSTSVFSSLLEDLVRGLDGNPPEVLFINLEDDAATTDALVRAGAEITLRSLRMEGAL